MTEPLLTAADAQPSVLLCTSTSVKHLASLVPGPVLVQKLAMAHIWFECISQTFVCWKCAFPKLVMLLWGRGGGDSLGPGGWGSCKTALVPIIPGQLPWEKSRLSFTPWLLFLHKEDPGDGAHSLQSFVMRYSYLICYEILKFHPLPSTLLSVKKNWGSGRLRGSSMIMSQRTENRDLRYV